MLKKILVATDYSPLGNAAVKRAILLAARDKAELRIVHAYPLLSRLDEYFGIKEAVSKRICTGLQSLMDKQLAQARELGVLQCSGMITEGSASEATLSLAGNYQPDLLVIGAHGRGFLQQIFLGGTVSRILAHATCPLLVIRRDNEDEYRQLLVAVDFSNCSKRVLKTALELANDANTTVVHAYEAPFEEKLRYSGFTKVDIEAYAEPTRDTAQQKMDALLADTIPVYPQLKSRLVHGHPNSVLPELAGELKANLISVGHHAGTTLEERVLGSITKLILYNAPCDVLVAIPKATTPP